MTTESLYNDIFSKTNNVISKVDATSVACSIVLAVIGAALFAYSFSFDANSASLSMLCLIIGAFGFVFGIIRLLFKNKKTIYVPTGSKVKKSRIYFKSDDLGKLLNAVENNFSNVGDLHQNESGTIRLDLMKSDDDAFAAAQVFSNSGATNSAQCGIKIYTGDAAKSLTIAIASFKKA